MLVVKYIEPWSQRHQQRWHSEALQTYGEKVIVRRRWGINDFAAGRVGRCTQCSAINFVPDQQKLIVNDAIGGSFTLSYDGETTDPINFNATLDDVETALQNLSNMPSGIEVSGLTLSRGFIIQFPVSEEEIPLITTESSLVPSSASVRILKTQKGSVSVYKQSGDTWCTSCFGVGFEGGFEPTIYVTWALITDQEQETTFGRSGTIQRETPMAQFSFEPQIAEYDLVIRVVEWEDKVTPKILHNRSVIRKVMPVTLRSGPGTPERSEVVYEPPDWKSPTDANKFDLEDQRWVIGQVGELNNLPLEHPWNSVPITQDGARVALVGTDAKHEWWNKLNAAAGIETEIET